jgi:hypothetical protein
VFVILKDLQMAVVAAGTSYKRVVTFALGISLDRSYLLAMAIPLR